MLSVLQWYTLKDVKSGRVHLILEWVPAVSNAARLEQVGPLVVLINSLSVPLCITWYWPQASWNATEQHSTAQSTLFTSHSIHVCCAVLCAAGTAAPVSPGLSEQNGPFCSSALCPCRESELIVCKSPAAYSQTVQKHRNYDSCSLTRAPLFFFFPAQLKKSGKEPKAGAELVLGETSYKTKVRLFLHAALY